MALYKACMFSRRLLSLRAYSSPEFGFTPLRADIVPNANVCFSRIERTLTTNSRLEKQRAVRGLRLGSKDTQTLGADDGSTKVAPQELVEADNSRFSDTITIVDTPEKARNVVKILEANPEHIWACDTEVADIDVKSQGPVGNGFVTCVSIFGGPDIDFGDGPGTSLWVDNLGSASGVLGCFKDWFENPQYKKVWHNYGFDRHVMGNMGIDCKGFYADTFHMARLWDTSRDKASGGGAGYGLEALSSELVEDNRLAKPRKDGTEGKVKELPDVRELQQNAIHREKWISYSAKDAVSTWWVRHELEMRLCRQDWMVNNERRGNMFEFYSTYFAPFGELLTDMERHGIKVDTDGHLRSAEMLARQDRSEMEKRFIDWAGNFCSDAQYLNTSSSSQMGAFLFGHYEKKKLLSRERVFKIDKPPEELEKERVEARLMEHDSTFGTAQKFRKAFEAMSHDFLVDACCSRGLNDEGTKEQLVQRLTDDSIRRERLHLVQKPKKWREITINSLGLTPTDYSPAGTPQVSATVLRKLTYKEACQAIGALANVGQIDSTITNFLVPLQALVDKNKRIHCSLNLNTETGRLSSRRPNLQNQPALEKDQYKIRDAFIAEPGNTLIVADYGQLELRLLAHITKCKSMLDAFRDGGCFHSRTAVGMYPHIAKAVESGDCLLEWDYSRGQPTVPLTLNFSIAYGKTVHGLALDWGISKDEAEETLNAWYADRPEVRDWQEMTRSMAKKHGYVCTLMGRYRILQDASSPRGGAANHALRAAINTPIQGSAADIVMMAMIKLWKSPVLEKLGWKLLLQIHDEVILEGPKESKDEAMAEVRKCMENPYDDYGLSKLSVFLDVDAKSADSWYQAK
eukprot:GSChrysophyteH1.ASY1.ANO1.726.1 assembled CDS